MVHTFFYSICDEGDVKRVRLTRAVLCPECGGTTMIRCYRKRKTKLFTGQVVWYKVPLLICEECGKVFTVLPEFIDCYKQYTN